MKKSLIALAALATVGAAQAQSSVTVSGRMDVGYSERELDVKAAAGNTNTKTTTIGANPFLTSFLAVSGSEDLGGGNRANFRVETGMSGAAATTLGNRGFWVELQGKNWGELRAGLQNTGARDIWTGMVQTGALNIVGDLTSSNDTVAGGTAGHTDFGTAIKYTTPNFNGLRASASISKANTDTTGVKTGADATSVGAFYTAGKLQLAGSYQKSTQDMAATAAVTARNGIKTTLGASPTITGAIAPGSTLSSGEVWLVAPVASADAVPAYQIDTKTTALGAMYDFGVARASVIHMDREQKATNAATAAFDRKATTFSVSAPVGKTVLFASYGTGENVQSGVKADLKAMQLGGRYFLSKRTYAYLATGQVKQEVSAAVQNDYKETAVGMLHLF